MTRIVGNRDRSEFILDPGEAWRQGRKLDGMLRAASAVAATGVMRAPHRIFNEIDDRRQLDKARLLNPVKSRA